MRKRNPAYTSGRMDAEVQRLISILRTAMRILGVSNRAVERKLGLSPSYLSRLFSGRIELKVEHLVHISKGMGLEPGELFHLAYPPPVQPGSAAAEQLYELFHTLQPPPEAPSGGLTDEQMEQVLEMIRKMLREKSE